MHRELMIYRIEKKHETRNSYWIANKNFTIDGYQGVNNHGADIRKFQKFCGFGSRHARQNKIM